MSKKITGNVAVDMISECIDHYKKHGQRLKAIILSHSYWRKFKEYLKKEMPHMDIDDAIDFRNIQIRKGSVFQIDSLKVEKFPVLTKA